MANNSRLKFANIIIMALLFFLFAVIIYIVSQEVIMTGFKKVETNDYKAKLVTINNTIKLDNTNLQGQVKDWAQWDDAFTFVNTDNQSFLDKNVLSNMLANLGIDYFAVVKPNFQILYIRAHDASGNEITTNIDPALEKQVIAASKYFSKNSNGIGDVQSFFGQTGDMTVLNSISYITKSDISPPSGGFMLMGLYYNNAKMVSIGNDDQQSLAIKSFAKESTAVKNNLNGNQTAIQYLNQNKAEGLVLINDYNSKPAAVIESTFNRTINTTAVDSTDFYLVFLYAITGLAMIIAALIFFRLVDSRKKQFEGEEKYQLLFNQNVIPLFLIKLAPDWKWLEVAEVNTAAQNLYHLNKDESLLKSPISILDGFTPMAIGDFNSTLSSIGIAVAQGFIVVDQQKIAVEVIGRAFVIGKDKFLLLNVKDLSERVQYEFRLRDYANNLKKFQLAVENASDQIIITDKEGIVIYANKAMQDVTGYDGKFLVGRKAGTKELWGGNMDKPFYENLWKTIKDDKKIYFGEAKNKRQTGEEYQADIQITPILDDAGNVKFFVGIERDITKAKEVDRAKTEFVSLASHQLRTPLSAINWYTEMLLAEDAGKITETQKEYLEEIARGNKRMVGLVNSLLNVSRIDLGTFDINTEPLDIIEVSKDVLKEMTPMIVAKNLDIVENYDRIPMLMLDPKLIRIVFQNLISNAIKYTPSKGKIAISIKADQATSSVKIQVIDTGYGIPKEQQEKIFTKLFRADNVQAMDTEGTGLGLYIVKSILDASGGQISFVSEENGGTTFMVNIPEKGMRDKSGTKSLDI